MRPRIELKKFLDPQTPVIKIAVTDVVTCKDRTPIRDAIDLILDSRKRRIPVVNKHFKGIVTVIDILDYLGAGSKGSKFRNLGNPVKRIMETRVPVFDEKEPVADVLRKFHRYRKGAYPVLHEKQLAGIVADFDFMKQVRKKLKVKVKDVMNKAFYVREHWPLVDVAKMMLHGPYRRLPVVEKGILLGILTPYDIVKYFNTRKRLEWFKSERAKVKDIMVKRVVTVGKDEDVSEAVRIMRESRIGGLPVVEEQELLGIITERDITNMLRA